MSSFESDQQSQYDHLYKNRTPNIHRPDTPTLTLKHLEAKGLLRTGATLLDIGCGIGKDVRLSVTKHGFSRAVGLDTSEGVIKNARAITNNQVASEVAKSISFICDTPDSFKDSESFDLVTSTSVIHLMKPESAESFLRAAADLVAESGALVVATKTLDSGDRRDVSAGGKSAELLESEKGYELHRSDDGLQRYYYSPEAMIGMISSAGRFQDIESSTVITPYGSVNDCEFVVAIAQ